MFELAVKGATHNCEGFGERKDVAADQQVVILGSNRMPKHAFRRDCDLGDQVCPCQGKALHGGASQGNSPDHPVLLPDVMGVKKTAEFVGLVVSRHCRRQTHPESLGSGQLDSPPGTCPGPASTMAVVALRRWTVEADLEGYALALQRAQRFEPASSKQHAIGEDSGRCRRSAHGEDLANIRQHERFAASDKDFVYAKFCRLDRDPTHALDTKGAPRSPG